MYIRLLKWYKKYWKQDNIHIEVIDLRLKALSSGVNFQEKIVDQILK